MSLATCDSLLAIKIKHKTLFKIILDTSDRLPQNLKPFSVDSEILSIVRTDATVAKRSGDAELPLSSIPFSRDLSCYHRNPLRLSQDLLLLPSMPPHVIRKISPIPRLSRNLLRCSDPPVPKTKISTFLQLFCD